MTPEQRQQLFVDEYNKLVAKYGYQIDAIIHTSQHGKLMQMLPQLAVVAVDDWSEDKSEITIS